jgi:mono/diheme cytochrome c family protein
MKIGMKDLTTTAALVGIAFVFMTSTALAQAKPQAKVEFGELEYMSSCAVCHGPKAKGDGEYKFFLTTSPTDLTTLAKRNGGVFPFQRVYEMVDGRQPVPAHGTRQMPIWGERYSDDLADYFYPYRPGPYQTEAFVRSRILALIDYLNRLQVK